MAARKKYLKACIHRKTRGMMNVNGKTELWFVFIFAPYYS